MKSIKGAVFSGIMCTIVVGCFVAYVWLAAYMINKGRMVIPLIMIALIFFIMGVGIYYAEDKR